MKYSELHDLTSNKQKKAQKATNVISIDTSWKSELTKQHPKAAGR